MRLFIYFIWVVVVLGSEPRAPCMLNKCSFIELYPQSFIQLRVFVWPALRMYVLTYLFTLLLKHLLMFHFLMGNISWIRISVGCLFRHRVARLCTQLYLKCYLFFFLNGLEQLTSSLQVLEYFRHVILQMTEHIENPFLIRLGLSVFFITSLPDPCFSSMVLT